MKRQAKMIHKLTRFVLLSIFVSFLFFVNTTISISGEEFFLTDTQHQYYTSNLSTTEGSTSFLFKEGQISGQIDPGQDNQRGSLKIEGRGKDIFFSAGGRLGTLNDHFAYGVKLTAGWMNKYLGASLTFKNEYTNRRREYQQMVLNTGFAFSDNWKAKVTGDYLNKAFSVDEWNWESDLNQYGIGAEVTCDLSQTFSFFSYYSHYRTHGEDYEGYLNGNLEIAIRGGNYDAVGMGMAFYDSKGRFSIETDGGYIRREYEAKLSLDKRKEKNFEAGIRTEVKDILGSGVNFKGSFRREFGSSAQDNWELELLRTIGPAILNLSYSETENDGMTKDHRAFIRVVIPLNKIVTKTGKIPNSDFYQKPYIKHSGISRYWVTTPVTGMGTPQLKVAEIVERSTQFVIDCEVITAGNAFAGLPATGSTHIWTMTSPTTNYMRYSVNFTGDTHLLPNSVPVTVTWTQGTALDFRWGPGGASSGSYTLDFPKTGGTIGIGGSVSDATGVRPNVATVPAGTTAGTVTFKAPGVITLVLTVTRP